MVRDDKFVKRCIVRKLLSKWVVIVDIRANENLVDSNKMISSGEIQKYIQKDVTSVDRSMNHS